MIMLNHTLWRRSLRDRVGFVLLLAAALSSGCGGGSEGPELASVKGTVLYNGKPVEAAIVEFVPAANSPWRSVGVTDAEGRFEITSDSATDGAVVGVNKVTVVSRPVLNITEEELEAQKKAAEEISDMSDKEERMKALMKNFSLGSPEARAKARGDKSAYLPMTRLPGKYATADTSGLTFEVKAGVPNDFQIVLTD